MESEIVSIKDDTVMVVTPMGSFWGNWRSSIRACYGKYNLELDCDDILEPLSIKHSSSEIPSIHESNGGIVISGMVEQIEDGLLYLRISTDLLMLEISDSINLSQFIHRYVDIFLSHIDLYPIDL